MLEKVQLEYAERKFTNLDDIKHIIDIFLSLSEKDLLKKSKQDILQEAKEYIDWLKDNEYLDLNLRSLSHPSQEIQVISNKSLAFSGETSSEFVELCSYIDQVREAERLAKMPDLAKELLEIMKGDYYQFCNMISVAYASQDPEKAKNNQIYCKIPILKYIEEQEFVNVLLAMEPIQHRELDQIFIGLKKRYNFYDYKDVLIEEFDWVKNIRKLLLQEAERKQGKVSGFRLKESIDVYLNPAIDIFERAEK